MSSPLTPEQAMQQLYTDAGALYADYNSLNTDVNNKTYTDLASIQADIVKQQSAMQALLGQLGATLQTLPPGPEQDALSQVVNSVDLSLINISRALGDISNPGTNDANIADAVTAMADVTGGEGGATGYAVAAYRQSLQWGAVQVQDALTNYNLPGNQTGANATTIENLLNAMSNYLSSLTPGDAAGALGLTTPQYVTLTTNLDNSITDITALVKAGGGPATTFTTDWDNTMEIIGNLPAAT